MIFLVFVYYLVFIWSFFLRNNFYSARLSPNSTDILKNSKIVKKINYKFVVFWNLVLFFYFFINFFLIRCDKFNFLSYHLKFNNFIYNIIIVLSVFIFFIFFVMSFFKNSNINNNFDYFISVFNLSCFMLFMYFCNNFYSFVFVLEIISVNILYKFSVSNYWFGKKSKKNSFEKTSSKNFLNMFFFQYWANFFSSILIFFTIFNLDFLFGSLDWAFINIFYKYNNFLIYFNNNVFYFIFSTFLLGFLLKIGLTPMHFFKLEVYKGLPFFSIFFYTTVYFLSFFLFFIILIFLNLNFYRNVIVIFFNFFIIFGGIYSIFLLFDVNLIKTFFAYSTVVNALNFIIISLTAY